MGDVQVQGGAVRGPGHLLLPEGVGELGPVQRGLCQDVLLEKCQALVSPRLSHGKPSMTTLLEKGTAPWRERFVRGLRGLGGCKGSRCVQVVGLSARRGGRSRSRKCLKNNALLKLGEGSVGDRIYLERNCGPSVDPKLKGNGVINKKRLQSSKPPKLNKGGVGDRMCGKRNCRHNRPRPP